MTRWAVEIGGTDDDLEAIASFSLPPTWQVTHSEKGWVLEAEELDVYDEASDALAHVREKLAPRINTLVRLLYVDPWRGHMTAGSAVWDQQSELGPFRKRSVFLAIRMSVAISVDGKLSVDGEHVSTETPNPEADLQTILFALKDDSIVTEASSYFSYEGRWATDLYKVYEIIKSDVRGDGGIQERRWATRGELSSFRHSVNHPGASAEQSRHARMDTDAPDDPMDEPTAFAFIGRLLECWLRERYANIGAGSATT